MWWEGKRCGWVPRQIRCEHDSDRRRCRTCCHGPPPPIWWTGQSRVWACTCWRSCWAGCRPWTMWSGAWARHWRDTRASPGPICWPRSCWPGAARFEAPSVASTYATTAKLPKDKTNTFLLIILIATNNFVTDLLIWFVVYSVNSNFNIV